MAGPIIPEIIIELYDVLVTTSADMVHYKIYDFIIFAERVKGETQTYTALDIHQIINN